MQIHGAKKGAGKQRKPHIAKDSAQSLDIFNGLYGLSEGEILGLVDGGKSIRLDGTPLVNDHGQPNFDGVQWEMRNGTIDQEHIAGFPNVANEVRTNVELRHDRAFTKSFTNPQLSAIGVRLKWGALREQKDNGDITGYRIEYAIDIATDGGTYREVLKTALNAKASQGYTRTHRIDLPKGRRWMLRVRRLTANRDSDLIGDAMSVEAVTEIIDAKLRYPCTAVLGLSYDAQTFGNVAKLAVRAKGLIIQVPSNYNPENRSYNGLWDGRFKLAYSNNPAWVYYDLCTNNRYGLGDRLDGLVDKWQLYQLAQYCDELVDDGKGGKEPRFTCNVYLQQREDAFKVLQNLAGIFHAFSYWNGEQVIVDADLPKDVLYTFSRANVIGDFEYTGTAAHARHTQVKVGWDDPENDYKTTYEIVPDQRAIAKYGVKTLEMSAFACTSQAQAIRLGKYALLSEKFETQQVSFKVGLEGFLPKVGSVVAISDNVLAGRDNGGRVKAVNGKTVTLDRNITKAFTAGDKLIINGTDGQAQIRDITAINGNTVTVREAFTTATADANWVMDSTDLTTMKVRVLSVVQADETSFTITALEYNPDKFAASELDIQVERKPISILPTAPIAPPASVAITATHKVNQGINLTTLSISWAQVSGAAAYQVEWRKDDGNWVNAGKITGLSFDVAGVYSGNYIARVVAIDAFDNHSQFATSKLTQIRGKVGKPNRPTLQVSGILFGIVLSWQFARGSNDTAYTEIQVSPDGRSNIATLAQYAYPTDKVEITGLQGGLTQYYRARIVDKLGNSSDWTNWTRGTTDNRADKVLDLVAGQIKESHLHNTLSQPIGKIGSLEVSVNSVNANLGNLNANLTAAKADITRAKNDLQTATANIATERSRISSAIRDISALQTDKTAKTREIANLTTQIGNATTKLNEIAVTTATHAQKLTTLQTASATANSKIRNIEQTAANQATSLRELTTKAGSNAATLSTLQNTVADNQRSLSTRIDGLNSKVGTAESGLRELRQSQATESEARAAAVRDLTAKVGSANSKIGTLEQTVTTKERALGQRVDTLNASFTTANASLSANISRLERTITTEKQALTERVDNLGASFSDAITVSDTRNDNQPPNWYWTNHPRRIVNEFKRSSVLGLPGFSDYINLETRVYWRDNTGGDIIQTAYHAADPTKQMQRKSSGRGAAATWQLWRAPFTELTEQATASIDTVKRSLADKERALSQRIDSLNASFTTELGKKATTAALTAAQTTLANADKAMAADIRRLNTATQSASAHISSLQTTVANHTTAIARVEESLTAKFDKAGLVGLNLLKDASAERRVAYGTRYELITAPAVGDDVVVTIWADVGSNRTGEIGIYNSEGYNELVKCRRIADGVYQGRGKWAHHTSPHSRIQDTHLNVYFYPNNGTVNNTIHQIKLEIGTTATPFTPSATELAAGLQTVKQVKATADGLSAQYTVKIDDGKRISGFGLASGAGQSFDFAINADKFYIAPPSGTAKGSRPFAVYTSPTTMNGVRVPAGTYLDAAYIANGSIDSAKIKNASITAAQIKDGAIDAAKIKDASIDAAKIKDGTITTAKIGTAQIDTLQIKGEAVIVPRVQHSTRQEFYDIDTEVVVNTVTLDAKGGAVSISFGFDSLSFGAANPSSNDGIVKLRIKRGNTVLRYREYGINSATTKFERWGDNGGTTRNIAGTGSYGQQIFLTFLDVPPAGNQTYTVTLESRRLNSGMRQGDRAAYPVVITERTLHIMGVKR